MTGDLTIDVVLQSEHWRAAPDAMESIAHRAVLTAWRRIRDGGRAAEVCVVLSDDAQLRRLNGRFRGQDKATNVLSFPAGDAAMPEPAPRVLGDIVIAYETVAREARDQGKTLPDHLSHLCVHGLLHLMGHSHAADSDAQAMEALEIAVLAELGIGNPFELPVLERER